MYLLQYDRQSKYKYAYKDASFGNYERSVCPECDRAVVLPRFMSERHQLILEGGKVYPDCLQFTGVGKQMFLFSDKSLDIFLQNEISGIGCISEVDIYNVAFQSLADAPKYYSADILGKIELNLFGMNLKRKRFCAQCGQFEWNRNRIEPLRVDENSWDGADVCRVTSIPGYIVCSSKFVDVINRNGLTGFSFLSL